jgi:hypothetical protein
MISYVRLLDPAGWLRGASPDRLADSQTPKQLLLQLIHLRRIAFGTFGVVVSDNVKNPVNDESEDLLCQLDANPGGVSTGRFGRDVYVSQD